MYALLAETLAAVRKDFDLLYGTTIPAFNEKTRARGLAQLMTVQEPDERDAPPDEEEDEGDDDWGE